MGSAAPAGRLALGVSRSMSRTKSSVSRPCVPLPTANANGVYFAVRSLSVFFACSSARSPATRLTRVCSSSLPVSSTTTHLQPLRCPGSMPITTRRPSGAASSSLRRFSANTSTASRSASIFWSMRASLSMLGHRSRETASSTAARSSPARGELVRTPAWP